MKSKTNPSSWQPGDLTTLKMFDDLFPENVRQAIATEIPDNIDAEKRHALVGTAIEIALELFAAEKHTGRATVSEMTAGILDIQDKTLLLKKAIASLDYDSRAQLHDAADPDGPDGDIAFAEM